MGYAVWSFVFDRTLPNKEDETQKSLDRGGSFWSCGILLYKETGERSASQKKIRKRIRAIEVRVETIVLPGGKIEISTPELIAGQHATVVVRVEDNESVEPRHVIDILRTLSGHQIFQNAEEVNTYLHEERDSWGIWPINC